MSNSFRPSYAGQAALFALLGLISGCQGQDKAPQSRDKTPGTLPNFIVFDIDSMRLDRLDESRRADTPALHSLVDRGVVFDAAYSSSGWTAPSLATLLLGAFPILERKHAGRGRAWFPTIQGVPTLPEVLGYYGYDTTAFWGGDGDGLLVGSSEIFGTSHKWARDHTASYDRDITTWLEQSAEPPFFALVHNLDLHRPGPPRMHDPSGPGAEPQPDCVPEAFGPQARQRTIDLGPEESVQHLIERYDCALICYDLSVARVLAALEATGLAGNTVVVLTSNHGELLREHDVFGHELLYEPVLHIPFVVVDPQDPEPRHVSEPVELQDLAPTLLSWAGATVPREMDGRSLLPLLNRSGPIEPLTEQFALTNRGNAAIRAEGYKLIRADDSLVDGPNLHALSERPRSGAWIELYDLEADPDELVDLAAERPELASELDARLGAWVEPRYAERGQPPSAMDGDLERALKERGYWETVAEPGAERKPPPPGAEREPPPPGAVEPQLGVLD